MLKGRGSAQHDWDSYEEDYHNKGDRIRLACKAGKFHDHPLKKEALKAECQCDDDGNNCSWKKLKFKFGDQDRDWKCIDEQDVSFKSKLLRLERFREKSCFITDYLSEG